MPRVLLTVAAVVAIAIGLWSYRVWSRAQLEDERTAWTYRSAHGFAITLPSDHWQVTETRHAVTAFGNRRRGADANVEVVSESEEAFRQSIEGMRDYLKVNGSSFEGPPSITEGTTAAGDPYLYWTALARDDGIALAAGSLTWCKNRGQTVGVMVRLPLRAGSASERAEERDYAERAVRTICLSVE